MDYSTYYATMETHVAGATMPPTVIGPACPGGTSLASTGMCCTNVVAGMPPGANSLCLRPPQSCIVPADCGAGFVCAVGTGGNICTPACLRGDDVYIWYKGELDSGDQVGMCCHHPGVCTAPLAQIGAGGATAALIAGVGLGLAAAALAHFTRNEPYRG